MRRIVHTPLARLDLVEIWNIIADDSEVAADRLLDRIDTLLISLRENPHMGRARPELGGAIRSLPVGNYIVYFLPLPDGVEVVRVRSGYLDIGPDDFE